MFDDEYYGHEEDLQKPDLSDESDMDENWALEQETMKEDDDDDKVGQTLGTVDEDVGHSSKSIGDNEPSTSEVKKSKRKRQTQVSEAIQRSKPVFDPSMA